MIAVRKLLVMMPTEIKGPKYNQILTLPIQSLQKQFDHKLKIYSGYDIFQSGHGSTVLVHLKVNKPNLFLNKSFF